MPVDASDCDKMDRNECNELDLPAAARKELRSYGDDRETYTVAKAEFVKEVTVRALCAFQQSFFSSRSLAVVPINLAVTLIGLAVILISLAVILVL